MFVSIYCATHSMYQNLNLFLLRELAMEHTPFLTKHRTCRGGPGSVMVWLLNFCFFNLMTVCESVMHPVETVAWILNLDLVLVAFLAAVTKHPTETTYGQVYMAPCAGIQCITAGGHLSRSSRRLQPLRGQRATGWCSAAFFFVFRPRGQALTVPPTHS